jgi:protein Tob/BTG
MSTQPSDAEISSACDFLKSMIGKVVSTQLAQQFRDTLHSKLSDRFKNHWFPATPTKGHAFRCIQSSSGRTDPLLASVLVQVMKGGEKQRRTVIQALPGRGEFTIWIDPGEVTLRVGDRGQLTMLYGTSTTTTTRRRAGSPESTRKQRSLSPSAKDFAPRSSPPQSPDMARSTRTTPATTPYAPPSRYFAGYHGYTTPSMMQPIPSSMYPNTASSNSSFHQQQSPQGYQQLASLWGHQGIAAAN